MGNWRRVHLSGACPDDEVKKLRDALRWRVGPRLDTCPACGLAGDGEVAPRRLVAANCALCDDLGGHPLLPLSSAGGMFGLPLWPATSFEVVGNLAEREFGPVDVRDTLLRLAVLAPGLEVTCHLGVDYEGDECTDTIRLKNGRADILPPEVATLPEIPMTQAMSHFLAALAGQ